MRICRYKGFTATIVSGVPFVALQMTIFGVRHCGPIVAFSLLCRFRTKHLVHHLHATVVVVQEIKSRLPVGADGKTSVLWMLPAGAFTGVVAQSLTYPGDTVRKLMITNGVNGSPRMYSTTWVRRPIAWHCIVCVSRSYSVSYR